jgi:4-amino-4-deoxy-L-arabinose transferase-like glycosyltransferase
MDKIMQYLPLIIPLIVIELLLMGAALFDLARRPKTRGPKWVWLLIIILVSTIGPIIYFVAGREEE